MQGSESSGILKPGLRDPGYVRIRDGTACSFGGSQMWFYLRGEKGGSRRICGQGCGLIAFADLLLYRASRDRRWFPESWKSFSGTPSFLKKESYIRLVRMLDRKYLRVLPMVGLTGPAVSFALNLFFLREKIPYRAAWKWALSPAKMLELMEEMLENDIPVIFSIGPNIPFVWGKRGVRLFRANLTETGSTVCRHFVTLTGIYTEQGSGKTMLRISSWGKEFYIDYGEYRDYIKKRSARFASSMVYIRRKKKG